MHRNRLLVAGLMIFSLGSSTVAAGEPQVKWYGDVPTAWHAARRARRPLLVFFVTDGCRFCHVMHNKTFRNQQVTADLEGSFVVAEINADEQPKIAERYEVQAFPTTMIFNTKGSVTHILKGYTEAAALRRHLDAARTAHRTKHAVTEPIPGQLTSTAH